MNQPNRNPIWGAWAAAPASIPEEQFFTTLRCDVAIAGAGIAGVSCALRAAQNGLRVIVVEKSKKWQARGGNIGVANSAFMKERGYENDISEVAREWIKRCGSRCDEEVVWRYLRCGGEAMDWLLEIVTRPEYGCRPELQANRYKAETYYEFMGSHRLFDGPMARKGLRPGASDAVFAMYTEAVKLGVRFLFETPAVQLLQDDAGRVNGLAARSPDGYLRVAAERGVVLATGDIGGNDEMCEDLAPIANRCAKKIYSPVGHNTGDGHRMGLWAGGAFENGPFPCMIHPQAFFPGTYATLFVDQKGKRFMNEDNYLQGRCNAILRRGEAWAWSILDAQWPKTLSDSIRYGGGLFWERDHSPEEPPFSEEETASALTRGLSAGTVVQADSPEELAEKMGVPAEAFVRTLDRYNAMCAAGADADFGKREELMIPLNRAPYYALKFGPALLAVVGGLRVNADSEVLTPESEAIPGLYAIGNTAGGRYGVDYPILIVGNSHGSALTFGYLLGNHLAEKG